MIFTYYTHFGIEEKRFVRVIESYVPCLSYSQNNQIKSALFQKPRIVGSHLLRIRSVRIDKVHAFFMCWGQAPILSFQKIL